VGACVVAAARRRGFTVTGTYASHRLPGLRRLDVRDAADVSGLIERLRPDAIVHAAALTDVDACERAPALAHACNVEPVRSAARAAHRVGARYCLVSSAYVFDGESRWPYREDDLPQPINVYGRTKLAAEDEARERLGDAALIVRTMAVYGPDPQGKNVLARIERALAEGAPIRAAADEAGNPTFGPDLADALVHLLERGELGTWHVAGPEVGLSRIALARTIVESLGGAPEAVIPVTRASAPERAPRPKDGSLAVGKLRAAGIELRPTAAALAAWRVTRQAQEAA
jgi:dTDP-4-dehydrorhamnose reductase